MGVHGVVFAILVVLCLAIAWVTLDHLPVVGEPWKSILKCLACVLAILAIGHSAGWW